MQLHLELANLPHYLTIDVNKLRQVLINLLSNAIKFTQQGLVVLRVSSTEQVNLVNPNEQPNPKFVALSFAVINTGIGIG